MTSPAPFDPMPAPLPLEFLSDHLSAHMTATNELILDRLQSPVNSIPDVARYLIAGGGKRIRPLLTLACAAMFNTPDARAHKLATAVEFIHSATLLHDDVVDGSDLRRGRQVANLVFGNKPAILVGDFLFARAFELMVETESLRVLHLLSHASAIIVEGEVAQLNATGNHSTNIDHYIHIIGAKTAALFAAACAAGPALYGADRDIQDALYTYGHHLGIAFQIADDVLDYTADTRTFGKMPGNDFNEGKITAPVIYALHFGGTTEHHFWTRCLTDRDIQPGDFELAQGYLRQHDAFSRSHILAESHRDQAIAALAPLPPHPLKETLMDLATFAVRRDK